jgi:hypothetical protein
MAQACERARRIEPVSLPADLDRHRADELSSLAYHRQVAKRLRRSTVDHARRQLWVWRDQDRIDPRYAEEWERVLSLPVATIKRVISDDTRHGRDLRQNSPFAGVLSEPERRAVLPRPKGS